jgi:hypothetical protein
MAAPAMHSMKRMSASNAMDDKKQVLFQSCNALMNYEDQDPVTRAFVLGIEKIGRGWRNHQAKYEQLH